MSVESHSEWFIKAFRTSPIGMAFVGMNGEILIVNPALYQMLGYEDSRLPFERIQDLLDLTPHDYTIIDLLKKDTLNEFTDEFQMVHKEGHKIWGQVYATVIKATNGEPQCFALHIVDITSNKKTKEVLEQSEKLSLAGRLAAGIAHEVRNPLTSIKGFIHLMKNNGSDPDGYLNVVSDEIDRMETILSELLMIGKPKETRFEWNDFKCLLDNVITLIRSQGSLFNVEIKTEYTSDIPQIYCDGIQMKQVFINFLKNAIEAMPDGGVVQVTSSIEDEELVVVVQDEGVGISIEEFQKIGQPFFTTKKNGTGLGLSICYQIIENHKGKIVISSDGNGTAIKVSLPIK